MARCAAESGGIVTSRQFGAGIGERHAVGEAFRVSAEFGDDASIGFAYFLGSGGEAIRGDGQAQAKRLADGKLPPEHEFGAAATHELGARGLGEFLAGLVDADRFEANAD